MNAFTLSAPEPRERKPRRVAKTLRRLAVCRAQLKALESLRAGGPQWLADLGCHVSHRLEARGLVQFIRPEGARRSVSLTAAGRQALADLSAAEHLTDLQPK